MQIIILRNSQGLQSLSEKESNCAHPEARKILLTQEYFPTYLLMDSLISGGINALCLSNFCSEIKINSCFGRRVGRSLSALAGSKMLPVLRAVQPVSQSLGRVIGLVACDRQNVTCLCCYICLYYYILIQIFTEVFWKLLQIG